MRYTPLTEGWTLRAVTNPRVPAGIRDARIAATVPGCVHTDLLAAGLIPDPFRDENENLVQWIGRTDWMYQIEFDYEPARDTGEKRVDLVCQGLDTVATLTLNDIEIARTQNMHRGYRFDVRAALRPGGNLLRVRFDSAYAYARSRRAELGFRPAAPYGPFNFIRKMASNFGWDWGPSLVTAGIWRPIGLQEWSTARLAQVRPLVTVTDGVGHVEVHAALARAASEPVVLTARVGDLSARTTVEAGVTEATLVLQVDDPALWWPRGYGTQPLYTLNVTLTDVNGTGLDEWRRRIGFRSVRLDTTPDEAGTPYTLIVNDVPVFVRGANWIPDDTFLDRVTRDRYETRLRQAADANVNYLRVWGGGRYEAEEFYQIADELGLLVGQDFLFACAAYPEEPPFPAEVEAEAREQVVRLSPHPSLVTWTGNNENLWGYRAWGWRYLLRGRSWGAGYYFDLLPRVLAELDPTRPYWPGSPYSGRPDLDPNDQAHGTMHIWDVWNRKDYLYYRALRPRFVAEFGYQGPPTYATLRHWLSDDPLSPGSPGIRHHQKQARGHRKLSRSLRTHMPPIRGNRRNPGGFDENGAFDDWLFLAQVNQARAIRVAVEHFRSLYGHCMGSIVWQLNDCWPVTSWSAIDGDGRKKPVWYALREVYADRLLTIQPVTPQSAPGAIPGYGKDRFAHGFKDGLKGRFAHGPKGVRKGGLKGALRLVAVNDSALPWHQEMEVSRRHLDGTVLAKLTVDLDVAARSMHEVVLPDEVATPGCPPEEFLVAGGVGDSRAWWFFAEDREIRYPSPDFAAVTEPFEGGVRVVVTAHTLLRDLCLFADRLDPASGADTALVSLLPGEQAVFSVRCGTTLDPVALTSAPVLRCVNDITSHPTSQVARPQKRLS